MTQQGESRLHYTFNLRQPILHGRGQYAAVSEGERGRVIYVFDPNGRAFTEIFDHSIHTFTINRTGILSVILQLDDGYAIYVFNRMSNGEPLFRRYIRDAGIIPTLAEISDDGRYIAVGLLDVRNFMTSKLQIGYTYRGDGWGTDGIFFEHNFQDEMIFNIRKTANNRLVAVTDAQIVVYTRDANDAVSITATIPLHNRLVEMAFDEEGRFAVALGSPLLNMPDAEPAGTVNIYDINGTLTGNHRAGRPVTHLSMGHGAVIVGTDRNFHALNQQGAQIWEFIALQDTRDFIFLENSDTVLIAGTTRADVWRRQRTRDGDADFFGIQGQDQ
jgi:hypothetical protein